MQRLKQFLKKWLDIQPPIEPKLNKDLEKKVEQLKKDLEYWHRTFKAFSVVPCAHCKKQMRIYPYGGAYYTTKDNQKVHAACYDKHRAHQRQVLHQKGESSERRT